MNNANLLNNTILTAGPSITEREVSYCIDAVQNGWNNHHSDYIKNFEETFRLYTGAHHSMATSSCTGAMHLALLALGIKEGDEVIVPEITWIATASVVTYLGAKPVFCDVDVDTWTMCPKSLERCITAKTKAIMPVHIYGHPCDMEPIWALAKKHNLFIVEDAAQSIGAEYKGQKTGSLGDASAFSFQGAKALVTGEGGILLCKDQKVFQKAQFKGDHGRDPSKTLFNIDIGYKYKMSNLQAALGLAQIERVEEIVDKKRQIFQWYYERLKNVDEISLNTEKKWAKNIYWMTSIVLHKNLNIERDAFISELKSRKIDSRPIFHPISSFPMFETQDNPNAYCVGPRGINLPSGHNRTEEEVHYVCEHIKNVIHNNSKIHPITGWLQYQEEVEQTIQDIKSGQSQYKHLPITNKEDQIGYLEAITYNCLNDEEDIKLLMKWRDENQECFPAQFKVTFEGTKKWLSNLLHDQKDRLLYFVCDNSGKKIGHIGLFRFNYQEKSCELDNVVRGINTIPGIMYHASRFIIDFVRNILDVDQVFLKVFSDNEKALKMYQKLNFLEINRSPLTKIIKEKIVYWEFFIPDNNKPVERYFVTMCQSYEK